MYNVQYTYYVAIESNLYVYSSRMDKTTISWVHTYTYRQASARVKKLETPLMLYVV